MHSENSIIFECSVCRESFREPYILKCLHSFCNGCIERRQNQDKESVMCKNCEQESSSKTLRKNWFFVNSMTTSLLEDLQEGNINCGNCSTGNELLKYCNECMEYLCEACAYCHQNTKLTRDHDLIPLDEFKEDLIIRSEKRAVFCSSHEESVVEEYCRTCEEVICRECELHQEHNVVSIAEGCSIEVPKLQMILQRATSKVRKSSLALRLISCSPVHVFLYISILSSFYTCIS